jgi:small subunit ribosomal protein S2
MAVTVDLKQMLEAGVHFGHKTSRWHPKMSPYIHSKRGEIHIIDLIETKAQLDTALKFVTEEVAKGKQVLMVGTKNQAKDLIKESAIANGQPYVTQRWLGGMLTNTKTMGARIKHLKSLEEKMESGELAAKYNKLEVQRFQEEIEQLNSVFSGVKDMRGMPGIVFVSDIMTDHNAVKEAKRLGIPVIGICDTNVDPTGIDFPIAANDDAIKSLSLITDYIAQAIAEGKAKSKVAPAKTKDEAPKDPTETTKESEKEE